MSLLIAATLAAEVLRGDCSGGTIEMNACLVERLTTDQTQLDRYLSVARKRIAADRPPVRVAFDKAQNVWTAYRKAACDAVYQNWIDGSIRGTMAVECKRRLTRERTLVVWRDWLTYMDSTPPILPEPPR